MEAKYVREQESAIKRTELMDKMGSFDDEDKKVSALR